jgi:hypothetical protein
MERSWTSPDKTASNADSCIPRKFMAEPQRFIPRKYLEFFIYRISLVMTTFEIVCNTLRRSPSRLLSFNQV